MNQNGAGPAAVEARGLATTYDEVEAVRGVDLRVESGEVFGFLGPNGAGKLTTLPTISSGSAAVAGIDVAATRRGAAADRRGAPGGGAGPAPERARAADPAVAAVRGDVGRGGRAREELLALVVASIWPGFLVVALAGTARLASNVRMINNYG